MKDAIAFFAILALAIVSPVYADDIDPAAALSGYDVVSYFTRGKAEKGSEQHFYVYEGARYYFSSDQQKKMFIAAPEKYLPQYDGYCAYGVTVGRKPEASPEAWKIVNG
jgi:YHS domain-containing protein